MYTHRHRESPWVLCRGVWRDHGKVGMCPRLLGGMGWSQGEEEKRFGTLRKQDSKYDPGLPHYHDGVYLSSLKDKLCFN